MIPPYMAPPAWSPFAAGWLNIASTWASMAQHATTAWVDAFIPPKPGRSWYREPAPELPFAAWPAMGLLQPPFSLPMLNPWLAPMLSTPAANPLLGWMPAAMQMAAASGFGSVGLAGWPGMAPASFNWFAPAFAYSGWSPLTSMLQSATALWMLPMQEAMAVASAAAATAFEVGSRSNPFAAYRSDGGHAVAQVVMGDPRAGASAAPSASWTSADRDRLH